MSFIEVFTWNLRVQFRTKRIYNTFISSFIGIALLILLPNVEIEELPTLKLYLLLFAIIGPWSLNFTAVNMIGMESLMWPIYSNMPNDLGRFFSYQSLAHGLLVAFFHGPLVICFLSRDELNESQKGIMLSIFFLAFPVKIFQSLYVSIFRNFYQIRVFSSQFVPPSFAPVLGLMLDVFVLLGCFLGVYYFNEAKATIIISFTLGILILAMFMSLHNTRLSRQFLHKRRFVIFQNIQRKE